MAREQIRVDLRRHGVVLLKPFVRSFGLAAVGAVVLSLPWPAPLLGPILVGFGATLALAAVWRWDRTRLVVTTDKVVLVEGVVRRRAAGVRLERVQAVEVEQSLLGRLLGYGTVVAGALRVDYVPGPREVAELLG
jgi:uncharacterized membrane protein YdbT with pleckstrin-like domain